MRDYAVIGTALVGVVYAGFIRSCGTEIYARKAGLSFDEARDRNGWQSMNVTILGLRASRAWMLWMVVWSIASMLCFVLAP